MRQPRLIAGALAVTGLVACGGGSSPEAPAGEGAVTPRAAPARIAVIARDADTPSATAHARAAQSLTAARFELAWQVPAAPTAAAQAAALADVLRARPRAVLVLPTSYTGLLPYLRLAHDAAVPVVVLDVPVRVANPTFVVSFVATDERSRAGAIAALLPGRARPGGVLVVGAGELPAGTAVANALRARLGATSVALASVAAGDPAAVTEAVSAAVAKHPEARAVVLADALVAAGAGEALRAPGRLVISAVRAAVTDEALRRGTLDAIVAADECTELREGVRLAIAAAENDATRLQPAITLPAQVLRSGSGPAGCPPG